MSGFFSWTEFFSLDKHLELRHSGLDLQQITKYSVHPSIDQVFTLEIQKITKYLLLHAQKVTKYSHWRSRIKTKYLHWTFNRFTSAMDTTLFSIRTIFQIL